MIGLQAAERFFEHPHGNFFVATMGADFGHHERLIPLASQRFAEALFAESVVILPCIVEKPDAVVESFGDDFHSSLIGFGGAEMIAAESHGGNLDAGSAERLLRHLSGGDLLRLFELLLRHAASGNERGRSQNGRSFDETTTILFELRSHGSPLNGPLLEFLFGKWVTRILGSAQHVLDFSLLRVEREAVGETRFRVIELQR
jgi:hypothetical protein